MDQILTLGMRACGATPLLSRTGSQYNALTVPIIQTVANCVPRVGVPVFGECSHLWQW